MKLSDIIFVIAFSLQSTYLLIRAEDCVFPFRYKEQTYSKCTDVDSEKKWCSLEAVYVDKWKYCEENCEFPFFYKNVQYNGCTKVDHDKEWCSLNRECGTDCKWKECNAVDNSDDDSNVDKLATSQCEFPFTYNGVAYDKCTNSGWYTWWCSNRDPEDQFWKTCDETPDCSFPFVYKGREYTECTLKDYSKPWCSIQKNYISGDYKFCEETACEIPYVDENTDICMRKDRNDSNIDLYCQDIVDPQHHVWKKCKVYSYGDTDAECAPEFTYNENQYIGCTFKDYSQPWCSVDEKYVSRQTKWKVCTGGTPIP